jgi:hypothetical protein
VKKNMQLARQLNEIHEQWARDNGYRKKRQAPSVKLQAPSSERNKQQASSVKHKGSSAKPQASSALIPDPGKSFTDL